jgi:hypothetical protein
MLEITGVHGGGGEPRVAHDRDRSAADGGYLGF